MDDPIVQLLRQIDTLTYIPETSLIDTHAYVIAARNAYVGVWNVSRRTFQIARFKTSIIPYLFEEYHWDVDPGLGTAKPLRHIGEVSHEILHDETALLDYLCELERLNPIVEGIDTVAQRRQSVERFLHKLSRKENIIKNQKDNNHGSI